MRLVELLRAGGQRATRWTERWVPDAFVVALVLTAVAFVLAIVLGGATPWRALTAWGDGLSSLLAFTAQACLTLLLGHVLATAPPIARLLDRVAASADPDRPWQAVMITCLFSCLTAWIHWGLTIAGSGIFARHVARRNPHTDYRLLVASAYLGIGTVWHAGLSGVAPLAVGTPANFLIEAGTLTDIIPITATVLTTFNVVLSILAAALGTAIAIAMTPPAAQAMRAPACSDAELLPATNDEPARSRAPAAMIEASPLWNVLLALALLAYLTGQLASRGAAAWTLDALNLLSLAAAVLLHGSPRSFLRACERGVRGIWGVVVQFPLYAGIFGLIQHTGLGHALAAALASVSSRTSFEPIAYLVTGALNYFVPSGGAKWPLEAPALLETAQAVGVPDANVVLAYAWGDMMTDLIQPFWAVALLATTRLRFGQIMGYLIVIWLAYVGLVLGAIVIWSR